MIDRIRMVSVALILAMAACGPLGGGSNAVVGPPSPTPPPIPTRPHPTPTGAGGAEAPGGTPSLPGNQLMTVIYGSARGEELGLYYLAQTADFVAEQSVGDSVHNAVWPAPSADGSSIAFVSVQSDLLINGIFVVNRADGVVTQLTHGDGANPQWSADGTKIAYTCNVNNLNILSKGDICVIGADGSNNVNLTEGSKASDSYPHWTPDGRIVFMSNRDVSTNGLFSEIYIMNGDGTEVTRLTKDARKYNVNPAVSPDGTEIVYESNREVAAGSELYVMNLDGTGQVRLTNDDFWNQNPVWSPDGKTLLYAQDDGTGNIDLYQINSDGTNPFRLTHVADEDGGVRLGQAYMPVPFQADQVRQEDKPDVVVKTPSGSSPVTNGVLFASNAFNCPECLETGIWFVTFDGAQLLQMPGIDGMFPAWSPDFQRFAFVKDGEIYLANADGSSVTQLTHGLREFTSTQWSADGTKLLTTCQPYGQYDACLVDTNTGEIRNITESLVFGPGVFYPTWISEERILLAQVVLDTNGVQVGSIGSVFKPRFSPDGSLIAGINSRQVVVSDATGTDITRLTTDAPTKAYPVWSPDSSLIVYSQAPGDGRVYLYAIREDGVNGPYRLVARPIAAGPSPRPDVLNVYFGYSWAP
jgi:Tol biopolymer transport system component